jgi:plasmid stabilization system protein ParE
VTSNFVVRPEAAVDIEEAHDWYESRSLGLGDRFLDAVGETIALVRDAPTRFPEKHREPDLSIRRALVDGFPYGVFFIWDEAADATSVIACMHAHRDPRRWLQRA